MLHLTREDARRLAVSAQLLSAERAAGIVDAIDSPHDMRMRPQSARAREWLAANDRFRRDALDRLRADGSLRPGESPDTAQVSWTSSG